MELLETKLQNVPQVRYFSMRIDEYEIRNVVGSVEEHVKVHAKSAKVSLYEDVRLLSFPCWDLVFRDGSSQTNSN